MRGNADWTPQRLTWVSLLLGWDEGQTLTARWEHACQAAQDLHPHWSLGTSYSGFTQALLRPTPPLVDALQRRLRRPMQAQAGAFWRRGRWRAFAVDGTRLAAPHPVAHEAALGGAGRDKTAPQVFLTVLWQRGLGRPWDYRVGPGTASERAPLKQMVADLPPRSLVVADAGFVGYTVCLRLLRHGQDFLLRVGGNITRLKDLGYYHEQRDGLVYLWPQKHRRCRPLVLRLIVLRQGKPDVSLLTHVRDPEGLTDAAAAASFGMRWDEEVFYRSYKQALKRRRLLSRPAATGLAEARWTLLAWWLVGLLTVSRLVSEGVDPLWFSVAQARDAVRHALRNSRPRRGPRSPDAALGAARKDPDRRSGSKAARN